MQPGFFRVNQVVTLNIPLPRFGKPAAENILTHPPGLFTFVSSSDVVNAVSFTSCLASSLVNVGCTTSGFDPINGLTFKFFLVNFLFVPRREVGNLLCLSLPPVWNLRAFSLIPLFSTIVFLPSPVVLSVVSFSAFGPFSSLLFP